MQQAAVAEILNFSLRIQACEQVQALALAVAADDRAVELASRRHAAANGGDVDHLIAFEPERLARYAGGELERQHAHADEVRAVDALEAFGDNRAHAEEAGALCGPVARRAGAVLDASDHDERHALLAITRRGRVDRQPLAVRMA